MTLAKILMNSKAESIFENDERFQAVERDRDRRDLFESFLEELKNKVYICIFIAPTSSLLTDVSHRPSLLYET